jgi:hypothetical protein
VQGIPLSAEALTDFLSEKRGSVRFPIIRDVQYSVTMGRGKCKSGTGKTVNLGSGGALFAAPEALASGKQIELSIHWPVRLDERCALRLVTRGRITRCLGTDVAVEFTNYEFRTCSPAGFTSPSR